MKNSKILSLYDFFLIAGIILANMCYLFLSGTADIIGSVAGVAGVICVVLVAKGNIWNYLFGIVNVSLYAWISFRAELYGDAFLNALYYFPMQFIGWWQWRKRGAAMSVSETDRNISVRARRMTWRQRGMMVLVLGTAIAAAGWLLDEIGDPQPYKDAATTVLSIVAQALMALVYMEQWILWIVTNILSVAMWTICAWNGEPYAEVMVIMWIFYLLNSLNGFRVWLKLSEVE